MLLYLTMIPEFHLNIGSIESPALSMVQPLEHALPCFGGDTISHSPAAIVRRAGQRDDPPGRRGYTPVIGRALPETTRPTPDESGVPLDVRKRGAPDQGSVAKDPAISIDEQRFVHTGSVARDHEIGSRCWTRRRGAIE